MRHCIKLYAFAQMIVKLFNTLERSKSQGGTRKSTVKKRPAIDVRHDRARRRYVSHLLYEYFELPENLCLRFCTSMDPSLPNHLSIDPLHQDVYPATALKSAVDFWHRNRSMLGDKAHCRCFGKVSQRAVFDTKPIRKKERVAPLWAELLEQPNAGKNEKPT